MSQIQYGIGEYSVRLNLQLFSDDRGSDIDNFTITVNEDDTVYTINDTIHHLRYNVIQSINITVTNCFGQQNFSLLNIFEGIYCVTHSG